MTTPLWLQDLVSRYSTKGRVDPRVQPRPLEVGIPESRFDPSAYYRQVKEVEEANREATETVRIQVENRRRIEEEKRRQAELEAARKAQEAALVRLQEKAMGISLTSRGPSKLSAQGFTQPLRNYNLTSGYGNRRHPIYGNTRLHTGLDMAAPMGTPIYATHSGTVSTAGWNGGYGNTVILSGPNGLQTYYAHQSRVAVKSGQFVQQGQVVGYVGSTGVSTGPHLHYEIRINGRHIDPAGYL